jgi:hypothetical protein
MCVCVCVCVYVRLEFDIDLGTTNICYIRYVLYIALHCFAFLLVLCTFLLGFVRVCMPTLYCVLVFIL